MNGRKTHPSETEEQEGFVNWFRAKFPGVLIFAIPNGGHRAISTAKRLKAEGVVPGIPDLHVPAWRLWIEMKRVKGGKLSALKKTLTISPLPRNASAKQPISRLFSHNLPNSIIPLQCLEMTNANQA